MADYNEYKTPQQSNIPFGETIKMVVKAPAIADRVFLTYADAHAFVTDPKSSAVAGISVSVTQDPNTALNGQYYVNDVDMVTHSGGLRLYRQGTVQSDWLEENSSNEGFIRHKPTTDYGAFTINPDGTVTETSYHDQFMDP